MDTNTIVKRFFWGAFAAFLLASIPHVAYFFRAYEPVAQGADDIWEWVVSYGIAASIDITIFLLSVTVSGLQRRNARKSLIFSVWIFIFALAVLSWYINDRYALHFMNTTMMSATALTINLWSFHVIISDINPLIASCFQILAIAYTWISDKLTNNEVPPTARELEVLAEELAAVKIAKDKIKSINKGRVTDGTIEAVDDTFKVLGHVASKLKREKKAKKVKENVSPVVVNKESDQVAQEADVVVEYEDDISAEMEPDTDPEMEAVSVENDTQMDADIQTDIPENITDISSVKKPRITQDLNPDMQSKRGAYAITKQAAAELLRCPISEIERGIMVGEIKPFAKDMDKVLRSSVEGFVPQKRSRKAAKVASK